MKGRPENDIIKYIKQLLQHQSQLLKLNDNEIIMNVGDYDINIKQINMNINFKLTFFYQISQKLLFLVEQSNQKKYYPVIDLILLINI
ncbi:hypothetical protein pb186bvf_020433 [Paramecium bursaria]